MAGNSRTIFIAGHARLPESVTGRSSYNFLFVEMEIDSSSGLVVDASCSALSPMGQRFIAQLLTGRSILESREEITREIETRYFGAAKRAIITAIENACERYNRYRSSPSSFE